LAVKRASQISEEMISSHEEMISSLELTTSTSDGLSDKENVVRLLTQHVKSTTNRLSNTVRLLHILSAGLSPLQLIGVAR